MKLTLPSLILLVARYRLIAHGATITVPPPTTFPTGCPATVNVLQAAVNSASAGDVIQLQAGNYYLECNVNVNKAITIQGACFDVPPDPDGNSRPGCAGESIIWADNVKSQNGLYGIQIRSSDVTVEGLVFKQNVSTFRSMIGVLSDCNFGDIPSGTYQNIILKHNYMVGEKVGSTCVWGGIANAPKVIKNLLLQGNVIKANQIALSDWEPIAFRGYSPFGASGNLVLENFQMINNNLHTATNKLVFRIQNNIMNGTTLIDGNTIIGNNATDGVCPFKTTLYKIPIYGENTGLLLSECSSSIEYVPTAQPTSSPTAQPSENPTASPSAQPTARPTALPTAQPTSSPTAQPSENPTASPSAQPTARPTALYNVSVVIDNSFLLLNVAVPDPITNAADYASLVSTITEALATLYPSGTVITILSIISTGGRNRILKGKTSLVEYSAALPPLSCIEFHCQDLAEDLISSTQLTVLESSDNNTLGTVLVELATQNNVPSLLGVQVESATNIELSNCGVSVEIIVPSVNGSPTAMPTRNPTKSPSSCRLITPAPTAMPSGPSPKPTSKSERKKPTNKPYLKPVKPTNKPYLKPMKPTKQPVFKPVKPTKQPVLKPVKAPKPVKPK